MRDIPYETVRRIVENNTNTDDIINELCDAGVNITSRRPQPTTNLFGRYATNNDGTQVLVCSNHPSQDGMVKVAWLDDTELKGTVVETRPLEALTFTEQATQPEDAVTGDAWIVDVHDVDSGTQRTSAVKHYSGHWCTALWGVNSSRDDDDITLIEPLLTRQMRDNKQDECETTTTKQEYAKLPNGTQPDVVHAQNAQPNSAWIASIDHRDECYLAIKDDDPYEPWNVCIDGVVENYENHRVTLVSPLVPTPYM